MSSAPTNCLLFDITLSRLLLKWLFIAKALIFLLRWLVLPYQLYCLQLAVV